MPFERTVEVGGRVFGNPVGGVIKRNNRIILNAGILKIALCLVPGIALQQSSTGWQKKVKSSKAVNGRL